MADNYARLADTIAGSSGMAYITINGSNRELFEIVSLTAQIDYTVTAKKMLGRRMLQHKVTGAEGTGSVTMYFENGELLKQAASYIKDGGYSAITLRIYNEDAASTIGRQEVLLNNVILATVLAASLDLDSDDPITFDSDFTFDGIEPLRYFDLPENYR
jgi:hypothetical protein